MTSCKLMDSQFWIGEREVSCVRIDSGSAETYLYIDNFCNIVAAEEIAYGSWYDIPVSIAKKKYGEMVKEAVYVA